MKEYKKVECEIWYVSSDNVEGFDMYIKYGDMVNNLRMSIGISDATFIHILNKEDKEKAKQWIIDNVEEHMKQFITDDLIDAIVNNISDLKETIVKEISLNN